MENGSRKGGGEAFPQNSPDFPVLGLDFNKNNCLVDCFVYFFITSLGVIYAFVLNWRL
jgi:hypothetical protein